MTKREMFCDMQVHAKAPGHVMVHLDARAPGVVVPGLNAKNEVLKLNFGHWRGRGDLMVDEWGIKETLRFDGVWHEVEVPWGAIYGFSADGCENVVYDESIPREVLEGVKNLLSAQIDEREAKAPPGPPKLRLVK